MAKVSKTIKKLRVSHSLTQDALAEKLFVSRQTVSSWENDRTQPDIEMLKTLSDVFDVTVEEIIYGEKRKTDPNAENAKKRKILTIVFSVLASLFVGVGLVLIFVTGWEKFPLPLKTVFAFAPMLAGQAAALYTYLKHRESIAWRECASVLWCAAVAGTVAMVDSIFELSSGFADCMLIDALLILPVIYLLDAVSPLIFYYFSVIYYGVYISEYPFSYGSPILFIIPGLFMLGLIYVILNRKKHEDIRHIYTVWISVIAALSMAGVSSVRVDASLIAVLTALCIGVYALDQTEYRTMPFKPLGILGTCAFSAASLFLWHPGFYADPMAGFRINIPAFVLSLIAVIAAVVCLFTGRRSLKKDLSKIIFCVSAFLCAIAEMLTYGTKTEGKPILYIILLVLTFVQAVILIVQGAKKLRFLELNAGLLLTAVILYTILGGFDINMLIAGVLFVLLGGLLFLINFLTARKVKKEKEARENA